MALTVREFVKKSLREFYKRLKQHLSDSYASKQEIEETEEIIATALNDLDSRIGVVEDTVPTIEVITNQELETLWNSI